MTEQGVRYPIPLVHPATDSLMDKVKRLLQVHKAPVGWLGEFPCTLKDPAKGLELVQCFTAGTKTTRLLLNLRLNFPMDPPLQHCWIDLTREAGECDPSVVHTLRSPFIKRGTTTAGYQSTQFYRGVSTRLAPQQPKP